MNLDFDFSRTQKIIFAPPIKKGEPKLKGRRIKIKGKDFIQFERITNNQAFHENVGLETGNENENLPDFFAREILKYKQANIFLDDAHYTAFNNKGAIKFHKNNTNNTGNITAKADSAASHNRRKNYIINEGDNVPALVELGIFTKDFKIVNSMYAKFKQINRFTELFNDLSEKIDEIYAKHGRINVIDFGCGKSYLTFVLYHYFVSIRKIPEEHLAITGVDLKASAIDDCNALARKYNYKSLRFEIGDIQNYEPDASGNGNPVNIIISLHGCDLATDYALYNAIRWNADIIFAAPCCEHEINAQNIKSMRNILKYGAVKERFSAILTNAIRCNLLELQNYKTELIEFVDLSHSPKNLLIRAVNMNTCKNRDQIQRELEETLAAFGVKQTLYELIIRGVQEL